MKYSSLYPRTAILDIGRAVDKATKAAPKRKGVFSPLPPKVRRAMQATKAEKAKFVEKFVAASCFDIRYHIHPVGDAFEVWDTESHDVVGTFETLRAARAFIEDATP